MTTIFKKDSELIVKAFEMNEVNTFNFNAIPVFRNFVTEIIFSRLSDFQYYGNYQTL